MRKIYASIIFISLLFLFSCEERGWIVTCSECSEEEPIEADLIIKIDKAYSPMVEIKIYEGDLEDNNLFRTISASVAQLSESVPINKRYTVTATYVLVDGDTYVAVDSAYPRIKFDEEQCDNPCYFPYDRTINLRIKYYY